MTRQERLKKLTNAIKNYRGAYDIRTGKWMRTPQPARLLNIIKWMQQLGLTTQEAAAGVKAINGFKNLGEMYAWVATHEKGTK